MSNLEEENTEIISMEMQFLMLAHDHSVALCEQAARLRSKYDDEPLVISLIEQMQTHLALYERTALRLAEENASHWEARLENLKWMEGLAK
jgi:hypothetical protein